MKKALLAALFGALAALFQHAVTLAQFRWCPRCAYSDPWTKCGGR